MNWIEHELLTRISDCAEDLKTARKMWRDKIHISVVLLCATYAPIHLFAWFVINAKWNEVLSYILIFAFMLFHIGGMIKFSKFVEENEDFKETFEVSEYRDKISITLKNLKKLLKDYNNGIEVTPHDIYEAYRY